MSIRVIREHTMGTQDPWCYREASASGPGPGHSHLSAARALLESAPRGLRVPLCSGAVKPRCDGQGPWGCLWPSWEHPTRLLCFLHCVRPQRHFHIPWFGRSPTSSSHRQRFAQSLLWGPDCLVSVHPRRWICHVPQATRPQHVPPSRRVRPPSTLTTTRGALGLCSQEAGEQSTPAAPGAQPARLPRAPGGGGTQCAHREPRLREAH